MHYCMRCYIAAAPLEALERKEDGESRPASLTSNLNNKNENFLEMVLIPSPQNSYGYTFHRLSFTVKENHIGSVVGPSHTQTDEHRIIFG